MGRAPSGREKGARAPGAWLEGRGREAGKNVLLRRGGEGWAGAAGGPGPAAVACASVSSEVPEAGS